MSSTAWDSDSEEKRDVLIREEDDPQISIPKDWIVDYKPIEKVGAPSFIRLFIIRRIIGSYVSTITQSTNNDQSSTKNSNENRNKNDVIRDLVAIFEDPDTKSVAQKILTRLVTNGIKEYMIKWYHIDVFEEQVIDTVELIFKQIILIKFDKKYQKLLTYSPHTTYALSQTVNNCNNCNNDSSTKQDKTISHPSKEEKQNDKSDNGTIDDYNNDDDDDNGDDQDKGIIKNIDENKEEIEENRENNAYEDVEVGVGRYTYQTLVFNTNDLMCSILEHFEYKNLYPHFKSERDLFHCSLVCSHWLYHVWNANSIYFVNLTQLLKETMWHVQYSLYLNIQHSLGMTRALTWQRLSNAKSIRIDLDDTDPKPSNSSLTKVSMLRNIEKITGVCQEYHIPIFKIIFQKNREKILKYDFQIHTIESNKISPLYLSNAINICIKNLYFYIKWSYKCQILQLGRFSGFDDTWCYFVINNCDCSGIKVLKLNQIGFDRLGGDHEDEDDTYKNKNRQSNILTNFAKKFEKSLRYFYICIDDYCSPKVLLFWKLLNPIIVKNKAKVELSISKYVYPRAYERLNEMIEESNVKIDKIEISLDAQSATIINTGYNVDNWKLFLECIKKTLLLLLSQNRLEYLKLDTSFDNNKSKALDAIINYMKKIVNLENSEQDGSGGGFESLQVIEIKDGMRGFSQLWVINRLLNLVIKMKQNIFLVIDININTGKQNDFNREFNTFCKNVVLLCVKQKKPIDIHVKVREVMNMTKFDQYNKIFLSYFDTKKIVNQQQVKCNQYCTALMKPNVLFSFDTDYFRGVLNVRNAENVNITYN